MVFGSCGQFFGQAGALEDLGEVGPVEIGFDFDEDVGTLLNEWGIHGERENPAILVADVAVEDGESGSKLNAGWEKRVGKDAVGGTKGENAEMADAVRIFTNSVADELGEGEVAEPIVDGLAGDFGVAGGKGDSSARGEGGSDLLLERRDRGQVWIPTGSRDIVCNFS